MMVEKLNLNGVQPKKLQSNILFDRVVTEMTKPELRDSGLQEMKQQKVQDSGESYDMDQAIPIVSDLPNLRKQTGIPMSKIPFSFTAFPDYFFSSGWIDLDGDPKKLAKRMKFLYWAFKKCSTTPKKIVFDGVMVTVEPYQFICGRLKSSEECGLTTKEFRGQLKMHIDAGMIEKRASQRANKYSVYAWLTSNFTENEGQPKGQPMGQPTGQPAGHKSDERRERRDNRDHPSIPSSENLKAPEVIDDSFQKIPKNKATENRVNVYRDVWLTKEEIAKCIEARGNYETVQLIVQKVRDWPGRKHEIKNWVETIINWKLKNTIVDMTETNKKLGKKIENAFEGSQGWTVRHYHDTLKDVMGLLFESSSGYGQPVFIKYSEGDFEKKVQETIKVKNMKPRGSR